MKSRRALKVLLSFLGIIIIACIFFTFDINRVKNKKNPIFCINYATYKDGGTKMYLGLGYKIIQYSTGNVEIGTIFLKYNNEKGRRIYVPINDVENNEL